jgi:hypothetical protein
MADAAGEPNRVLALQGIDSQGPSLPSRDRLGRHLLRSKGKPLIKIGQN